MWKNILEYEEMDYKILYSPESQRDMDDIWDFIEEEYYNPKLASDTVNEIIEAINNLKVFPEIGTPLYRIVPIGTNYRFIVSGNHNIFYRTERDHIYIDRVLHKKRNYISILFDL